MEDMKQWLQPTDWFVSTCDFDAILGGSWKYLENIFRRLNFPLKQVSLEVVDGARGH